MKQGRTSSYKPVIEALEARDVPTVSLAPITNPPPIWQGKHTYIPLNGLDDQGLPVTYTVSSSNSSVVASLVQGGRTIAMDVSFRPATGTTNVTGTIFIRLFEDKAPLTTARIIELIESGFYNNLTFHRVINDFVAQGGDPDGDGSGGSGVVFSDEFHPTLAFTSYGMLAMANSGRDTNDSQFFLVDTNLSASANFPQHLNFKHTIFGQITGGLNIFEQLIATPVTNDRPTTDAVITKMTLINDNQNGIVDLSAAAGFLGTSTITVTAKNSKGEASVQTFAANVVIDNNRGPQVLDDPAFFNTFNTKLYTKMDTPISFDLVGDDIDNDTLQFIVQNTDFSPITPADNFSFTLTSLGNKSTRVTVTPAAGFTGTLTFKVGVSGKANPSLEADFDTEVITLQVIDGPIPPTNLKLNPSANIQPGNFSLNDTPTITLNATTGSTVKIFRGATEIGEATETSTPGLFTFTFPRGALLPGANSIVAFSEEGADISLGSTALNITYAPTLKDIFVVPPTFDTNGVLQAFTKVRFDFVKSFADFKSEMGVFVVDDAAGTVDGIAPGAAGYTSAVMNNTTRQLLFNTQLGGSTATKELEFAPGTKLGFYLVQNGRASEVASGKVVFYSFKAGNGDGVIHLESTPDRANGRSLYGWEDMTGGGDRDYNDFVFAVKAKSSSIPGIIAVDAAAPVQTVATTFNLLVTNKNRFAALTGEVGFFPVLDDQGSVAAPTATDKTRKLRPGDAGYLEAALNQSGTQVLFAAGDVPGRTDARTFDLAGGTLFGFYYVPKDSLANLLANNPTNSLSDPSDPIAFFSIESMNPDNKVHVRSFAPERESRFGLTPLPVENEPQRFHFSGQINPTDASFDDFVITMGQRVK